MMNDCRLLKGWPIHYTLSSILLRNTLVTKIMLKINEEKLKKSKCYKLFAAAFMWELCCECAFLSYQGRNCLLKWRTHCVTAKWIQSMTHFIIYIIKNAVPCINYIVFTPEIIYYGNPYCKR